MGLHRARRIRRHPGQSIRYVVTPMALVDLAAILPFYLPLLFPFDARMLRLIRLVRLLRLLKVIRYSESWRVFTDFYRMKKSELAMVFLVVLFLLVFASAVIYHVEQEAQPVAFSSIPAAMWWGGRNADDGRLRRYLSGHAARQVLRRDHRLAGHRSVCVASRYSRLGFCRRFAPQVEQHVLLPALQRRDYPQIAVARFCPCGKTSLVAVLGGKGRDRGEYIISEKGQRDGENIYKAQGHTGNYFL